MVNTLANPHSDCGFTRIPNGDLWLPRPINGGTERQKPNLLQLKEPTVQQSVLSSMAKRRQVSSGVCMGVTWSNQPCVSSPFGRSRMIASADLGGNKKVAEGNSFRVVVVDDEFVIANTLGIILRGNGYDTVSFTNPLTALEMVPEYRPHIVVTDVMMPQLSGIEFAIRLKRLCPECKFLLFSGSAEPSDLLDASQRGYNFRLLRKPANPTEFLRELRALHA
jgi:CheY-like chemotaxis protein